MPSFSKILGLTPIILVDAAPKDDYVFSLPSYGPPPTRQWSGFLDATDGCDTEKNGFCKLHYWLAEAEGAGSSPSNGFGDIKNDKPTVLWLNGGPGSTSLIGFLQENGPLLMNSTGGFMENPYAWTKYVNLVALEQPVGVGYSYCETQLTSGGEKLCTNTDKFTASASRAAMVDFFHNKFPELLDNDFFIVGESYAGVYIPTITKEILDWNEGSPTKPPLPIRGVGVGDPCTDTDAQLLSMDTLWYSHKNGMVPEQDFNFLWNTCGARSPSIQSIGGRHVVEQKIKEEMAKRELARRNGLQSYEAYEDGIPEEKSFMKGIFNPAAKSGEKKSDEATHFQIFSELYAPGPNFNKDDKKCKAAFRRFLISSSHGISQGWAPQWIMPYSLFAPAQIDAKEDNAMSTYMMRKDVMEALNIDAAAQMATGGVWPTPSKGFNYKMEYHACNFENTGEPSMINFYYNIAPRLDITMVFNGDSDPCVSYEGTRTAISRVGFKEMEGGNYRPWFYNHEKVPDENVFNYKAPLFGPNLASVNLGPQFGGNIVNYENNLAFLTVHGSGHMVPQFRPQAALRMLRNLLTKDPMGSFAPALWNNATMETITDVDFEDKMNRWTDSAKKKPTLEAEVPSNVEGELLAAEQELEMIHM